MGVSACLVLNNEVATNSYLYPFDKGVERRIIMHL